MRCCAVWRRWALVWRGGAGKEGSDTQLVLFGCDVQCGDYNVAAVGLEAGVSRITGSTAVDVMATATCHIRNCDVSFNDVRPRHHLHQSVK